MGFVTDLFDSNQTARFALAGALGGLLGIITAFTVNCTLIEISRNGFFSVYFGLLFVLISGIILWRVKSGTHPKPFVLTCFALMVLVSGLLCFVLQKEWFLRLSWLHKLPVFGLLGSAVTFALLFALVDILNSVFSYCQSERSRPIVETEFQVYLVVSTAMVMGLIFGLIFGALDMESEPLTNIRAALLRQQSLAYPAGALVGGAAAVMNQYLRENSSSFAYDPLKDEDLDDDDF